jgi:pilus assembly protein CpaE
MARSIQVLLVEETEKERAVLRKQLALADFAVIGESAFGQEAFTLARELRPDVVVISMEEPVIRALRTIETFTATMPEVVVVTVSSLRRSDDLRKAMVAGSREYLTKPLQPQQLREGILAAVRAEEKRRVFTRPAQVSAWDAPQARTGTIITVFGAKGGIGKTTLTTNLAANLAAVTHSKVGILDLDHQFGAAAVMMDLLPQMTLDEFMRSRATIDDEVVQEMLLPHPSGISMLSLPCEPDSLAYLDHAEVSRILDVMGRHFDYVLVDTPPAINGGVRAAMTTSTMVLIVTSLEVACIKNTRLCLDFMRDWEFFQDKVKVVINRPNAANSLKQADLEATLEYPIITKIPFDTEIAMASQLGRQLAFPEVKTAAGEPLNELLYAISGVRAQQKSSNPFSRLLGAR